MNDELKGDVFLARRLSFIVLFPRPAAFGRTGPAGGGI
jgi:hypothetical protein